MQLMYIGNTDRGHHDVKDIRRKKIARDTRKQGDSLLQNGRFIAGVATMRSHEAMQEVVHEPIGPIRSEMDWAHRQEDTA
jgi:hypothetical protein